MTTAADLEARILADLDEVEPYRVYADWLQAQGEPRGELMAIQLRLEEVTDSRERRALAKAERNLLLQHQELLLGPIAEADPMLAQLRPRAATPLFIMEWRRGFLSSLRNKYLFGADEHARRAYLEALRRVLEHPSARLLRKVHVGASSQEDAGQFVEGLLSCLERAQLPALDSLQFDGRAFRWLEPLARVVPRLKHLHLASSFRLNDRAELKELVTLYIGDLEALDALGLLSLPRLEVLKTDFVPAHNLANRHLGWLTALPLPNLRTFSVKRLASPIFLASLAGSEHAARLERLSVGLATPNSPTQQRAVASTLVGCIDSFPELKALGVELPESAREERAALREAFGERVEFSPGSGSP